MVGIFHPTLNMKFDEQLLGTLEVLNENLYQTFYWNSSIKGFNIWSLMNYEKFIKYTTLEIVLESWLKEEQTHSIAPRQNYSIEEPEPKRFLDVTTKAEREEKYHSLLQLLKSNLQYLEAFTVSFPRANREDDGLPEYSQRDYFCGVIGKSADNNWIAISPTVPQRHEFPNWFSHSPLVLGDVEPPSFRYQAQPSHEKLKSSIEEILQELSPLKLAVCYPAGYGYTYDYQFFCAASPTKEAAFTQVLLMAKILAVKKFNYIIANTDSYYYDNPSRKREQILSKFLQQNFSDIRVYRISSYDIDYTYVLGRADTDWLGIRVNRHYEYNP